MPSTPSSTRWMTVLNGEITDTQRCCDSLETASADLKASTLKKSYEADPSLPQYIESVQNCLRKVLQFWAKGQQNEKNKWNLCALCLSVSMVNLITCDHGSDFSKCYKLMGFMLAKSSCMGEVTTICRINCRCLNICVAERRVIHISRRMCTFSRCANIKK
jgi:hypothetical protein